MSYTAIITAGTTTQKMIVPEVLIEMQGGVEGWIANLTTILLETYEELTATDINITVTEGGH